MKLEIENIENDIEMTRKDLDQVDYSGHEKHMEKRDMVDAE